MPSFRTKLRRLSARQHMVLWQGASALALVTVCLRLFSYGRTRRILGFLSPSPAPDTSGVSTDDIKMTDLVWSVAALSHHIPVTTTCLQRTMALWWLLRWHGLDSQIRIGAVRSEEGILAHAWLERNEVVVNDRADVAGRFMAFKDVQ